MTNKCTIISQIITLLRHYRVILKDPVINTLQSYTSISNAAVGNTKNIIKIIEDQQAIIYSHIKNTRLKLLKTNAAIWFNKNIILATAAFVILV